VQVHAVRTTSYLEATGAERTRRPQARRCKLGAMETRQALHALVDELPEPELPAAKRFLEYLRQATDPFQLALDSTPVDDEPLTEDDLAAIRQGFADRDTGETLSHDEVKRLFHEAK